MNTPNKNIPIIQIQKNLFFFNFAKSADNSLFISISSSDQIDIIALKAFLALIKRDDVTSLICKGERKL